jgi:hypothetical protein
LQPSCLTVNETDVPESADTAEAAAADPKISAKEELEVINLSSDPNVHKPVSISASLSVEERMHLVELLKEYRDVFAWQYDEMPGIDPKLIAYSLNVEPGTRPVVQPMRTFHPEVEAQITQKVKKLLSAGFIKPIQHPWWLSNIVLVKKKNGQIRCCVDFCNLNKVCLEDEFPLPNMDLLIDSAAGQQCSPLCTVLAVIIKSSCLQRTPRRPHSAHLLGTSTTPSCHSDSRMPEPHIKGP